MGEDQKELDPGGGDKGKVVVSRNKKERGCPKKS